MKKGEKYKKEARTMINPVLSDADKMTDDRKTDCIKREGYLENIRNILRKWVCI